MSWTYYRFTRDIESGDASEWWRIDPAAPPGWQVEFTGDGGHTWEQSIMPTAAWFLADIGDDAVVVDEPGAVTERRRAMVETLATLEERDRRQFGESGG